MCKRGYEPPTLFFMFECDIIPFTSNFNLIFIFLNTFIYIFIHQFILFVFLLISIFVYLCSVLCLFFKIVLLFYFDFTFVHFFYKGSKFKSIYVFSLKLFLFTFVQNSIFLIKKIELRLNSYLILILQFEKNNNNSKIF